MALRDRIASASVAAFLAAACADVATAGESLLEPFSHTYVVTADVKGRHIVASHWHDVLDYVTINGKPAFRRTQISTQTNGNVRTWISVFDTATLAPVSDTFNTSDGTIFARVFHAGYVTDYSSDDPQKGLLKTARAAVPEGYSDFNSGQFGLALLRLPLAPNYATTLTTFGPTDANVQLIPIAVTGMETVRLNGCSRNAYVVRATFAATYYPDEGENYMTFWVSKQPPYVLRLLLDTPKTGLKVSFDLDEKSATC
jgi:hypothetical protein